MIRALAIAATLAASGCAHYRPADVRAIIIPSCSLEAAADAYHARDAAYRAWDHGRPVRAYVSRQQAEASYDALVRSVGLVVGLSVDLRPPRAPK